MSTRRSGHGEMNPSAAPFVPLASPQTSFATHHARTPRSHLQTEKYEDDAASPGRNQVTWSCMGKGTSQPSGGSSPISCFASSITQTRCEVSQSHERLIMCVCDQILRPTAAAASGESVDDKNPFTRLKIRRPGGTSSGAENRRKKAERGSAAAADKILENSEPNIGRGGGRVPKSPKATAPQLHRMASEGITSDTNNGNVPDKVGSQKPCKLGKQSLMESQGPQHVLMDGAPMPGPVPVPMPMPPAVRPSYIYPAVPPQQHGGGIIFHPRPPMLPVYPPPPPEACFPLLHMVPYPIMPNSAAQPQPNQYALALGVAYWPPRHFAMPNTSLQTDHQNPSYHPEEMDNRNHGHLAHNPHHLALLGPAPTNPYSVVEEQMCSAVGDGALGSPHRDFSRGIEILESAPMQPNLADNKAVEYERNVREKFDDRASRAEAATPVCYQRPSDGMGPPSAVGGPHAREENGQDKRQPPQRDLQVLSSLHHHNASNQSTPHSKSKFAQRPSH